jgi:hypothetical protein
MNAYEIPLDPQAQTLTLNGGGNSYNLRVTWCSAADCWILDILDGNSAPIVQGIPLITGVNLLSQYEYLGIGGALVVQTDSDPAVVPTYELLGVTGHLFYVVAA